MDQISTFDTSGYRSFLRKQESRLITVRRYHVYILASRKNGTLYVGISSNLVKRVYEHKKGVVEGFTKKYNVHRLVHYEEYDDPYAAITREKRLKKWKRAWKIELIEKSNPQWKDLYSDML